MDQKINRSRSYRELLGEGELDHRLRTGSARDLTVLENLEGLERRGSFGAFISWANKTKKEKQLTRLEDKPRKASRGVEMSPQNNHQHSNQQKNQHSNSTHSIEERKLKVLVLGKDGVGKSALIVRYLTRRFIGEYDPYLEGVYQKTIKSTGNHFINVELKDTAMDINWSKRSKDLAWADMLIMVYSITDRSSFLEVQKVKKLVEQLHKTRGTCCMVVGNKTDMGHERAVTLLEGDSLATGMCGSFHELSVAENHIEIENKLSRAIRERFNAKYQIKSLASKSSTEIRHKSRMERPKSQPDLKALEEEAKTERRGGRALWRKFRDK